MYNGPVAIQLVLCYFDDFFFCFLMDFLSTAQCSQWLARNYYNSVILESCRFTRQLEILLEEEKNQTSSAYRPLSQRYSGNKRMSHFKSFICHSYIHIFSAICCLNRAFGDLHFTSRPVKTYYITIMVSITLCCTMYIMHSVSSYWSKTSANANALRKFSQKNTLCDVSWCWQKHWQPRSFWYTYQ